MPAHDPIHNAKWRPDPWAEHIRGLARRFRAKQVSPDGMSPAERAAVAEYLVTHRRPREGP